MNITKLLEAFAQLGQGDQAWIMTTLLDFKSLHLEEFEERYGSVVLVLIEGLERKGTASLDDAYLESRQMEAERKGTQ